MCVESRRVRRGKPVRVSPSAEKSPGRTVSHRGTPYRCFLPDLTRFSVPAAQDPGSSQRAVKRGGIVTRTVPEPKGSGRTSTQPRDHWTDEGRSPTHAIVAIRLLALSLIISVAAA